GRRIEHDDIPTLRTAEPVIELAHEYAVVLLQRELHRSLADLGDLYDEQVENDRDDDRKSERLHDLQDRAPRKGRSADGFLVFGTGDGLGSGHLKTVYGRARAVDGTGRDQLAESGDQSGARALDHLGGAVLGESTEVLIEPGARISADLFDQSGAVSLERAR